MAIFKSTAFSKLRNSFGNLTTCRSKGQNIVKEKVTTVFNPRDACATNATASDEDAGGFVCGV